MNFKYTPVFFRKPQKISEVPCILLLYCDFAEDSYIDSTNYAMFHPLFLEIEIDCCVGRTNERVLRSVRG